VDRRTSRIVAIAGLVVIIVVIAIAFAVHPR
jgi:CHASE3 domain sensor protein